jgi:hypothetical protein
VTRGENIIRRWVRLKQAARVVCKADTVTAHDGVVPAAARTEAETTSDAPFDLASLPSIESIAANTDIVAFLRAGVPPELMRAALRRAWSTDPSIRDFIGIAENQWDFNDPEAIPGFGPLTTVEDSADALAQISSRLEQAIADVTSPRDLASSPAFPDRPSADVWLAQAIDKNISSDEIPEQSESGQLEDDHVPRNRRRHGGALPR